MERSVGGDLEVLAARQNGSSAGIPCRLCPGMAEWSAHRPTGIRHGSARSPLTTLPTTNSLSALRERARNWFDLVFLPAAEPFADAVGDSEMSTIRRVVLSSPYIVTEGSWDEFLSGHSRRRQMRKAERRLGAKGAVLFEVVDSGPRLEPALEEGLAVEDSGWKAEAGTAILSQPATAQFYRELADWAASRGELRLWFLRVDGRAIAFAYCLEVRTGSITSSRPASTPTTAASAPAFF